MFCYTAFGLSILSEIELPGMIECLDVDHDIEIILGNVDIPRLATDVEGSNYKMINENVYLWWVNIGKFKIELGSKIIIEPIHDLDVNIESEIILFLLGPVMAILLHMRGYLVLHGSSIKSNNGAIAFLGYSKFGKSTTAFSFYRKGYPMLTDDIIAIKIDKKGLPILYPAYPHLRLFEDSFNYIKDNSNELHQVYNFGNKNIVNTPRGFSIEPIVLKAIYLLDTNNMTEILSLNPKKGLLALIRHSKTKIFNPEIQVKNLIQCSQIINNVPVRCLKISHSFKNLSNYVKLLEDDFLTI